ncbi:MAG: lamin tail domain-containing protein [Planctomycetes bacterium]|nr:lamin tail domain-containing protein [Planctomycetota bacterium]
MSLTSVPLFQPLEPRLLLAGFTAYNDTVVGPQTHANTTLYTDNGGDASGQLKNIATGAETPVLLTAVCVGATFGGTGVNPAAGTDARNIFGGYVDFTSVSGANAIEMSGSASYTYQFADLDPGNTYEFVGTAVRGSNNYTDRWTLVTLLGADAFTPAHSSGVGIVTAGLPANQVALWTGANHLASQGFVVQWTGIDPGDDGEFEVVSQQYTGAIPTSVDPVGFADGSKGYGLNGIRLIEKAPTAPPTVVNTPAADVEAFSARIGGQVVSTGGQSPNAWIYFGDNDGGTVAGNWDACIDLGTQTGEFSGLISNLSPGTTYYYRVFAENSVGSAWAPTTASFTTLVAAAPSVINLAAAQVGAYSARLYGRVTDTGNDSPLVTVYYGTHDGGTNPAGWDHAIDLGVQSGEFYGAVSQLDPTTTYYFAAHARNAVGEAWAAPSLSFQTLTPSPLAVTEFMADNSVTLLTRTRASVGVAFAGDYSSPDWIEIYNPTDAAAALDGFYLTDDLDAPQQWAFPAGTTLAAGGYLVVFASGDDIRDPRLDERGYLHTNFKLNDSGGEDVALVGAGGMVVSAFTDYPAQIEDTSYGLGADGQPRFFTAPTPGWDNANDVPQAPRFSAASTTFTGSLVVNLTACHPTDTIHYTLDETLPTAASPVWSSAATLTNTAMVRAVSIGANGKSSGVVSETYIALGADVLSASSNLPYIIVETFGDGVPGTRTVFGDSFIAFFEPGADGRARLTDALTLGTRGGIHVRGSSSAGFPKKQYRVEFWDESNQDRRLEVLGLPPEADWIFYGPGTYDRVLISNPLMFELSNQIGSYAVRTTWVEVYLNANGGQVTASDYVGLYAVMEVIESGDDRVDVEPLSTGAGGVPVQGGFIWKNDRGSPYVDPELPNAAQQTYINSWITGLEAAASSANFRDPVLGYAAWADAGSFIDHNLLNMLAMNVDAMRLSGFYYKTADGKLQAGPIWDFDRSLDSTDIRDNNPLWWNGTGDSTLYFNDGTRVRVWWPRMFQDPDFVQKYIDRWFQLRQDSFSLANLYAAIDAQAAQLQEAAPRDYARWSAARYGTFAGEIQHLKDWLTSRVNWIDSQWVARPTFSIPGPVVAPGTLVTLSAAAGSIYYTLDGSDPRAPGGGISPKAIRATGPIAITQDLQFTARVYRAGYVPSYGAPGYVASGDDWSAPVVAEYFVNPLVASGNLVVSEIHYHPADPTPQELAGQPPAAPDYGDNDFEFIELTNVSGHTVNVRGVRFTGGIQFEFGSHALADGARIVVVGNLEAFTARYGINGSLSGTGIIVAGQWTGDLDNAGERLVIAARDGATVLDFAYDDDGAWPGRADGKGASLELLDPQAVPAAEPQRQAYLQDAANWRSSNRYGGSPGTAGSPDIPIVINEVLTHTDDPLTDAIELHNTSATETVDLSGWWLSDSWGWEWSTQNGDYKKFRIPDGTVLLPGEYRVFWQGHFVGGVMYYADNEFGGGAKGFGLDAAHGDDVWLLKADAAGNLMQFVDHVEFGAAANGESFGRWPDGDGILYPMATRTLPGENSGPRIGPLVISEVHYNPGADDNLEFIEIHNPTGAAVNLWEHCLVDGQWRDYSWKLEGFEFPVGTTLAAGEVLVVVPFDPGNTVLLNAFKAGYGLAGSAVRILGGYGAYLDNGGETVRLSRPDEPPLEEPTFSPYLLVDEVQYDDKAPWPTGPDGGGLSLHRSWFSAWGDAAEGWYAAAPTPGEIGPALPPPQVLQVVLNPAGPGQSRPYRTVGGIDPGGLGIATITVVFSEAVYFTAAGVTLRKVTFEGAAEVPAPEELAPLTVAGSGTATMCIEFAPASVVDTWVKVRLIAAGITSAATGIPLDGDPRTDASGLGYLYEAAADLPTGDGSPGGDAVFYVGSLRGDFNGDLSIGPEDKVGFGDAWRAGNLDADFRGVGFGPRPPDGRITIADINGFTSVYQAGAALLRHLDPLPVGGGGQAAGVTPLPALPLFLPEADILAEAAGRLPLSQQAPLVFTGQQTSLSSQSDEDAPDAMRIRRLRPVAAAEGVRSIVLPHNTYCVPGGWRRADG